MTDYDYTIVGTGPAAYFLCLSIFKNNPNSKIKIYEAGADKNLIDTNDFLNSRNFSNHRDFELRVKRFGDIIVSIILIFFSLPILIISGILIWINDRGPIFHTQIREGMFDKKLKIIKLRTMIINAEKGGAQRVELCSGLTDGGTEH